MAKREESELLRNEKNTAVVYTQPKFDRKEQKFYIHKVVGNKVADTFYSLTQVGATELFNTLLKGYQDKITELEKSSKGVLNPETREWRINVCLQLHLLGFSVTDIFHYINKGGRDGTDFTMMWDLSYSQTKRYIQKGLQALHSTVDEDRENIIKEAKKRWTTLTELSIRAGDLTNARGASKELDRLNGIDQVNVNVRITDYSKLSDLELQNELRKHGITT